MDPQKNDFSKGSVPVAILKMAGPMTVAQLVHIFYNIVDRMYIGQMPVTGRLALTGIGLTLPIISILIGFANLCGIGGAPHCSIARGKGDHEEAEHIMGNAFAMLMIIGVLLTIVLILFKRPILYLFGASDDTYPYANGYATIYLMGTLFVMTSLGMNPFINSQGFGRVGMMTVILGAGINIVLDPIFIFALHMGIRGAALATVISQFCSSIWVLRFLTGKKAILLLRFRHFRLRAATVLKILSLGVSGFCFAITNSLVQILCNATLQKMGGDLYVSAMTVINSIKEMVTLPMTGVTSGAIPVMSFNYGAKEYERVRQGIRFGSLLTFGCGIFAWLLIMIAPGLLIKIFNSDPELLKVGIPAFRVYFAAIFLMGAQLAGQSVSQALGKAKMAVFFSLLRKAVIVAPLTVILPNLWGLGTTGVFLAEPISNVIGGLACYITHDRRRLYPAGTSGKRARIPACAVTKKHAKSPGFIRGSLLFICPCGQYPHGIIRAPFENKGSPDLRALWSQLALTALRGCFCSLNLTLSRDL